MIFSSHHGRHVKRHPLTNTVIRMVIVFSFIVSLSWSTGTKADAATLAWGSPTSAGNVALDWAESHAYGAWYEWGGTGPYGYDCSGLIYEAFLREGIVLPRTTYGMLGSWHLVRTYTPERGDLAFYGSGHVEFVTIWNGVTFGAHDPGSRIGWIEYGWGWVPTMFFHVIR